MEEDFLRFKDINKSFARKMSDKYDLDLEIYTLSPYAWDKVNFKALWYHWTPGEFSKAIMKLVEHKEKEKDAKNI